LIDPTVLGAVEISNSTKIEAWLTSE